MASGLITSWQVDGETMETVTDFILGGSKITKDGDCNHVIIERRGGDALDSYYARVADRQAYFTLEAFERDGLKGMYDYWERIRIEENCDMTHEYDDTCYHCHMNTCPSLSKVLDNDAEPCGRYCDHCPGWVGRVIAMADHFLIFLF